MKIVFVTETFLPSTDGIVTRLCTTIDWLLEQGHEVHVIAPDGGVTEYNGIAIDTIPSRTFFFYPSKKFSLPNVRVKQLLVSYKPDIIHVVNPALLGISGIYYGKQLNIPTIASYHTNLAQYLDYYRMPLLKPLMWTYLRLLHNRADINLCTSQSVLQELTERKFKNVFIWDREVDLHRFHPNKKSEEMRDRLTDGHPEQPLLLFVGRLAREKQIHELRRVMDELPDVRLAIVGDGPYREELKTLFEGTNTVFTGFLHGEELAQAYASADLFVFPSTTETVGLVLLEAMASGLSVVAAKSGPTLEQVRHGETGLLYEPEQVDTFPQLVKKMMNNTLRSQMSIKARKHMEKMGWHHAIEKLFRIYELTVKETNVPSAVSNISSSKLGNSQSLK
jgi:glycosyltransferase involved in cell wall biosynthesis